jgi:hypothetical protein
VAEVACSLDDENDKVGKPEKDGASAPEIYSAVRRAAFLLENAVDPADYAAACRSVRAMGLDPDAVPHQRPER